MMCSGKDNHEVLSSEDLELQAWDVSRIADESQIEGPVQQLLNLFAAGERMQHEVNAWALLAKGPDGFGHGGVARRTDEFHPEFPALIGGHGCDIANRIVQVRDGCLDPVHEGLACRRQDHTAGGALIGAFVELHVEQGRGLIDLDQPIAIAS